MMDLFVVEVRGEEEREAKCLREMERGEERKRYGILLYIMRIQEE